MPWSENDALTPENVRLPELERLRGLVEHSDWHSDDPYQQSLRLARWMARLPEGLPALKGSPAGGWEAWLRAGVDPYGGQHSRRSLLAFAALIHDAGKAPTYQRLPDGATRCPGHEAAGAQLAPGLCARFDFTAPETAFITRLVAAHGEPYALFKESGRLAYRPRQAALAGFEAGHADLLLPLLVLSLGDLVTSQLAQLNPPKYRAVLAFYAREVERILSREG